LKCENELIKVSAFPVDCIDTTGAGDLYAAGFLYGLLKDLSLEKCGNIGSLLAGKVIEIVGARMDKDKFTEIKREVELILEEK
jgi:sugar/nucleoside kinase (ribokinase family)